MTQLTHNPALLHIEDRLDAVGQKYRGQRIVRGAILWIATAIVVTWCTALAAHFAGDATVWTYLLAAVWLAALVAGAIVWLVRPLLIRPGAVEVARLLESRVAGLHNGLTNSVLLSRADDLQASPWLPQIFHEVQANLDRQPIDGAVRLSDLRPMLVRATLVSLPLLIIAMLIPRPFVHGLNQLLHPSAFVPQVAAVRIVDVQPGDVTLVRDQPLEITATASGPQQQTPEATLIFDDGSLPAATISPSPSSTDGSLRYTYRLEHVDHSLKYRLEIAGTQSRWFNVSVVRQIMLQSLTLKVTPPAYTKKASALITLKSMQWQDTPVTVPQGSVVELSAAIDVPANAAMLQLADRSPTPMSGNPERTSFSATFTVTDDTPSSVLLTDGAGQIVAKLPVDPWTIHCTKDAAPTIEMRWPMQDAVVAPSAELKIQAAIKDDYGVASARVLMASGSATDPASAALAPVATINYPAGSTAVDLASVLDLSPDLRKHGNAIRVQVEATDNRDLGSAGGAQTTSSPIFEIKFRDPETIAKEEKESSDKLRAILMEMLKTQQALHAQTLVWKSSPQEMRKINSGQSDLRATMESTAKTFTFEPADQIVQKTLLVLSLNPAKDAVEQSNPLMNTASPPTPGSEGTPEDPDRSRGKSGSSEYLRPGVGGRSTLSKDQARLVDDLETSQRRIINTLESLLALLNASPEPTSQPTTRPGDQLVSKPDAFKKLDDQLKQFIKEQQKILDQTAGLAKKPVDNFTDADKKLLADLLQQEDKLDAFMKAAISDFSKLGEQDMSNASLIKDAMAIYSEVTMAKDALAQKATEIAVPAEEGGLEGAQELETNIEKWLADKPDRQQWTQEELPEKNDAPMPELPKELDDMVGELMEQQEDLFDQVEDMNANITDSADKGIGWDAMDGPIADMSAKGVTGNVLPNNNEMGGRSGEGRSGRSQGEFVGDSAVGKGGRNTPTRLDPTPFQQGQINDTSKDPVGGATGGGKLSGQGAAGLEGPVPPKIQEGLKRLATKQAELRNTAERLNLQYKLDRYDNFRMAESILMMRRVESDLNANRYQSALRRRDVLLDDLDTSHLLTSGRIHVEQDTTPTTSLKTQRDLNDAMKGELPPAWSEALKEYYKKLAAE
jgi:hypothetical protein